MDGTPLDGAPWRGALGPPNSSLHDTLLGGALQTRS
jgi:hypothetical protein